MNFEKIVARSKEVGIDEIEIYAGTSIGTSIALFNGEVDKFTVKELEVVSVRGIYQGKMGYITTEKLNDDDIDSLLDALKQNALMIESKEESIIYEGSKEYRLLPKKENPFVKVSSADKIELLKTLEQTIKSTDERIKQVSNCSYSETVSEVKIINSKGLNLQKSDFYGFMMAAGVARTENEVTSTFDYQIKDDFNAFDPLTLGQEIAKATVSKLNADTVSSKSYPIVLKSDVVSDLLGAFKGMFSGEMLFKNLTLLKGKENTQIMGENITIIDDPFFEEGLSKSSFDDEGVACNEFELVKNGVFKGFMHNLKTAKIFGVSPTGHGFKPSIYASVGVAPTNLYVKPGIHSFDQLLDGIKEGIYITEVEGLHSGIDPVSGSFSLKSSGFLIENGKLSRAVKLIVMSGKFLDLFSNVERIGNDLRFTYSGIGSPSIRVKELQISGK